MYLATLGGTASTFKISIDAYRDALSEAGHNPEEYPVATAGFFYTAETTQQALKEAFPHIAALENVLIPETLKIHQQRLREAGFRSVDCWFQCFNFASLIAFK